MNMVSKLDKYWQHPALYWPLLILFAAATPFTFAPYYHFWLMPLIFYAFVRLIELRPRFAVSSAYLFGLTAYTTQFYWIHTALHDVSGLPDLYAVPLTFLLPAYLALYPALCFLAVEKIYPASGHKNRFGTAHPVDADRVCPRTFPDRIRLGRNRLLPNHPGQPARRLCPIGRHPHGYTGNRLSRCLAGFGE